MGGQQITVLSCPAFKAETKSTRSISVEAVVAEGTYSGLGLVTQEQNPEQWIPPHFPNAELKAGVFDSL